MKEPKLRFKADDGSDFPDWEEKKLGDMFSISAGGDIDKNNSSKEKSCSYPYPVYANALMNDGLYGYANYFKVDGDTFTVTGRGDVGYAVARHCKYVPIVRLLVCRPKENDNVDFFAEQVNCARIFIESTGVPQLTAPQLAVIKLLRPSLPEQQKIADFLSTIDTIIEKQRATVSAWEERKKGVMQKLFSQEVRFKADDGSDFPDWEECTVGELFVPVVKKNKDGSIQNVITNSAQYGLIPQRDFFDKDIAIKENTSNYTIIQNGDFVYNPRKSTTAPFGPFNIYERDEAGIVSPLYTCLTPKYKEMTPYLSWYFRTNKWHPYIVTHGAQSGARHDRVGMTATLMNGIPVIYPSLPEQQKIADCLSALDAVIEQQKETLEKWQELKKGLLQQMFV
mgnify:CR=1 FL=1